MKNKFTGYANTFDRFASIVFFLIGVAILIYSQTLTKDSLGSTIGPGDMPALWASLLIILSIVNMVNAFRNNAPAKAKADLDYKTFLPYLIALIIYALVIEMLGYVISTFLFLLVTFQIMKKGHIIKSVIIAAAFSLTVYGLYVGVAKGSLPPMPFIGI